MGALVIDDKFLFPFALATVMVEEGAGAVLFSAKTL
jgi:hypothetical protein